MGKEKKKPNEKNSKEKKSKEEKIELLKTVVLIALIILCLVGAGVIYYFNTQTPEAKEKELAYTELITTINKGEVEKLEMTTEKLMNLFKDANINDDLSDRSLLV